MAKKNKVPKRIAGVKVPKALRRGLRYLARSQNGRTLLIEALTAAGAAMAATQAEPGSKTRRLAAERGPKLGAADARAATVAALEDAARSFTEALRRRRAPETPPPEPAATPSVSTH